MKKFIILVIFIVLFPIVRAENDFVIDSNKINISDKGNSLITGLDKEYNIDTTGYTSTEDVEMEAKEYTKKIINILFHSANSDEKRNAMHNEQLISSTNGFDTLISTALIDSFLVDIDNAKIVYDYVKLIRTIETTDGTITVSYFPNALVDGKRQDFIIILYLKKEAGEYKVFMPWLSKGEDLEAYFNSLGNSEDNGEELAGTYKSLSTEEENKDEERFKELYDNNLLSNVTISALNDGGTNKYGNGFFIREGLVVTTWSLLLEILNNSEFIYVTDSNKNSYQVEGIVTANTNYDIVVLKIKEEIGKPVTFSKDLLIKDDLIFSIVSQNNNNFIFKYGKNITNYNGKYKNMFALIDSDVGSALYNKDGNVVGFNTNNSLNNDISVANSTNYLVDLQSIFINKSYDEIKTVDFDEFKDRYYNPVNEEKVSNKISDKIWNKYKNIGKIEDKLKLKLLKSYYTDNILSLRYKNEIANSIDSMLLIADFEKELLNEGYEKTYSESEKEVFTKGNSVIVIKENLDYVIVIFMER